MIRFIPDSAMMESILRDSSLMDPYQYIQNVLHLRQDCTYAHYCLNRVFEHIKDTWNKINIMVMGMYIRFMFWNDHTA